MVYLFEDRKGRMQQYLHKELDPNYIKESIFDCSQDSIDSYISTNYSDAKCILFHKSYTFPQDGITVDFIKQKFLNKYVPFVLFSGGLQNNLLDENNIKTGTVDSGDMYNNLHLFINEYRSKQLINIPLLVFGRNYLLNSLLDLQNKINMMLFSYKHEDVLNENILDEIHDEVDSRINEVEFRDDKSKFLSWLDDNMNTSSITVKLIKSQIQKLVDKYYE